MCVFVCVEYAFVNIKDIYVYDVHDPIQVGPYLDCHHKIWTALHCQNRICMADIDKACAIHIEDAISNLQSILSCH